MADVGAVSITATGVIPSTSAALDVQTIAAGNTITAGMALCQIADGTVGKCDADAASPINAFYGLAMTGGSAGQKCVIARSDAGGLNLGATVAVGLPIFASSFTAGGLTTNFTDLASGSLVTAIGMGVNTAAINLHPITSISGTKA